MALTFPGSLGKINSEVGNIDSLFGLAANYTTIPATRAITVAANTQVDIFTSLTIDGMLTVLGELRVVNWPT